MDRYPVTQGDGKGVRVEKQRRVPGVPQRSPEFAHLPLPGLRQYRRALTQEESRVSYWRRIMQARLDVVRSLDGSSVGPDLDALRPVLGADRVGAARSALLDVVPFDDIPPLPHLESLWDRDPVAGAEDHNAALAADLVKAETQLSAYRAALHRRLSAATTELIARYREQPSLCLCALPLPRRHSDAETG
ncbi:MAG: hypothetical protein QOE45_3265 [Frankiaceae bacterium]|jgi:hypothetical protein|nr:hypothetical protein [Frankiaceae bacterium]